jgi:hypothetical protein
MDNGQLSQLELTIKVGREQTQKISLRICCYKKGFQLEEKDIINLIKVSYASLLLKAKGS